MNIVKSVALAIVVFCLPAVAIAQESKDPIRLALNEWSTQQILTQIAGQLLEKMGYEVELVTAGYYPQIEAIRSGEIAVTMEFWTDNVPEGFTNQIETGEIESAGSIGFDGVVGWWYPVSFEKSCPGLPDYEALLKCQDQLLSPDTFPNPKFVEYPAEWGNTFNQERFAALGFTFQAIPAGSDGALVAEMRSAHEVGTPLVIMMYSPSVVFSETDFKLVDLPAYEPACESDPAWGVNPNATFDCGFPSADIVKIVWPGMKEKWPNAYKLIQSFEVSLEQNLALMKAADIDGVRQEEIVENWLAEHEDLWRGWIAKAGG